MMKKDIEQKGAECPFQATALVQSNGLVGALLYPTEYPYFCCQAIRVRDEEELKKLEIQFRAKHLPIYLPRSGDKLLLVVQTSGTSPGHEVEITQDNHAAVYEAARKLFQKLADWCGEHSDIFGIFPLTIPLS